MEIQLPDNLNPRFLAVLEKLEPAVRDVAESDKRYQEEVLENVTVSLNQKDTWQFEAYKAFDLIFVSTNQFKSFGAISTLITRFICVLRGFLLTVHSSTIRENGNNALLSEVIDWATKNLFGQEISDYPADFSTVNLKRVQT